MQIKIRSNLVGGIASLCFGLLLILMIPSHINLTTSSGSVLINQRFFPGFSAALMGVMGIVLLFQSLVLKKEKIIVVDTKDELRMLLYFVIIVVLVFLMKYIGFLVTSCLITVFSFVFFKCRKIFYYIWSLVFVVGVYFLFKVALGIPLP